MSMLDDCRLRVLASHQTSKFLRRAACAREGRREAVPRKPQNLPVREGPRGPGKLDLHGCFFEISEARLLVLRELSGEFYTI